MSHTINPSQFALAFMLGAAVLLLPSLGHAFILEDVLCTAAGWFSSGTGKALATIGITIIGIGALLGKVSWGMALIVGIGVALVFGANSIVDALNGPNVGGDCAVADSVGGLPDDPDKI